MDEINLISINDALNSSAKENIKRYRDYINPGLVKLLNLIKINKKFNRAEGFYIWDEQGNRYLDFLGGYGALNFGHNNREFIEAITEFLCFNYPNILQISLNGLTSALSMNLAAITPGKLEKAFFCNSGAEAVEGALKIARKATGRKKIIYTENSFHGKTFGALSVTGRAKYQKPFEPLLPDCKDVPYGEIAPLESILEKKDAAAFIVEPIQGEGGMNVPPEGYLKKAEELCRYYGTLLIVDEIQTGFGRTGNNFACEYEKIEPDIMTIAKSLGGGLIPAAAYLSTNEVWKKRLR